MHNGACFNDPQDGAAPLDHALDFFVVRTLKHSILGNRDRKVTACRRISHDRLVMSTAAAQRNEGNRTGSNRCNDRDAQGNLDPHDLLISCEGYKGDALCHEPVSSRFRSESHP